MNTRIIVHYLNGSTFTGEWNESYDFKTLSKKPISSLQIQQGDGKYHTLSCKKKQFNTYWQKDIVKENIIESRSILRKLNKNVWLELSVSCVSGKRKVTIIREDLEA